jgi:hypothetical protein
MNLLRKRQETILIGHKRIGDLPNGASKLIFDAVFVVVVFGGGGGGGGGNFNAHHPFVPDVYM